VHLAEDLCLLLDRRDALIAVLRRVFRGEIEADRWTGPLITVLHEMVELDLVHGT
jgi:hypothetical protein